MKKVIFLSIFILAIVCCFFFTRSVKQGVANKTDSVSILRETFNDYMVNSRLRINLKNVTFINEQYDTVSNLSIALKISDDLPVIYLSEKQCIDCQMDAIKKLKLSYNKDVLIIGSYHNLNQLLMTKKQAAVKGKVFNTITDVFPDYISSSNTPYFFILDKDLNALSFLKHNVDMPDISNMYFKTIFQ